jgi:site-specific DNA recombinase
VDAPENRKRYKVNASESPTVRRIFDLAARGVSLKEIAKELNREGVRPPRPGSRKQYNSWCPSGIRDMLRREIYVGRLTWNKSRWVKAPGTNRRLRRPRPQSEWITIEQPELRIVTDQVWAAVRAKNERTMARYSGGAKKGLARRADTVPHIMSGFLTCGVCGANIVIVSGRGGRYARYGCSQAWNRGTCSNKLTIKLDDVERIFFSELQQYALSPNGIDQVLGEFVRQLEVTSSERDVVEKQLQAERRTIQQELDNFMVALAEGISAKSLRTAISDRERTLQMVETKLRQLKKAKPCIDLLELRNFATQKLFDVVALLNTDRKRAKNELRQHLEELRMTPTRDGGGRPYYCGEGRWKIEAGSLWMNDCRKFKTEVEGNRQALESKEQVSSVGNVAGGGFEPPTFGL